MCGSVWRPLKGPVIDSPLALCDYRTVEDSDRLKADHVSALSTVEVYQFKFNKNHRWYYLGGQSTDEVCIFIAFDSHPPDGTINCRYALFAGCYQELTDFLTFRTRR